MPIQNGKASGVKGEQGCAGSKSCRAQVKEGCKPGFPWEFCHLQGSNDSPGRWGWNSSFMFCYMGLKTCLRIFLVYPWRGTLGTCELLYHFYFNWKASPNPIWNCREIWPPKTCIFQIICWKGKKEKENGPFLMTEPFVCKNFSEMTLGFSIHVFGADAWHKLKCLYITQSFSFTGISEIFFFPFAQKMDWDYGHDKIHQRNTVLDLQRKSVYLHGYGRLP